MTAEVATALVSASGAILAAVAGYMFTKRAEREAKWAKNKPTENEPLNGLFSEERLRPTRSVERTANVAAHLPGPFADRRKRLVGFFR
jgi:hypothetical protein